jgi:hypothetical protein
MNPDPDAVPGMDPDPGFGDQKLKNYTAEIFFLFFLNQNLQFTYPYRPP